MRPEEHKGAPDDKADSVGEGPLASPFPEDQRQRVEGDDQPRPFCAAERREEYKEDCNNAQKGLDAEQYVVHDLDFEQDADEGQREQPEDNM